MEFTEVIGARHSVRNYREDPVEDDKLVRVLESARWAPSWANKQCWRFVVVRDPVKRAEVSKAALGVNKWLKKAPVIIAACGDPARSGTRAGIQYYTVDVSIAMQQLVLAATDEGLGTCWIGAFMEESIKETLGIPAHFRVVALTPLGYPADSEGLRGNITRAVVKSKTRKPLDDMVHYDGW